MRTLSIVLFSLSVILALENGSDKKDVGAALIPECAVNCIKEHVPNSGCSLLHITCLCDPEFRVKHGPIIAPCLIALCDANEISKVENAWRGHGGGYFDCRRCFCLARNLKFNFKLNSKTNAYTNTEIIDEFNDEFNQLIRKRNGIHKLDDDQHSHRSIKTNPNPD
ncbi:hypothetical protein CEP53_012416 [Fusarium sp. AF-6]|nr:hypothetical protein CEP53_012416 [Fusarium sp. AF-6]